MSCLLYADDLVILSDNEINLQAILIYPYATGVKNGTLKLILRNPILYIFVQIGEKNSEFEFKINNQVINYVDYYKYLGV